MAQVQLDNYSGHEETSQDSLTEVDESRPPNPSLILSPQKAMETRATDPSVNLSSPRAPECLMIGNHIFRKQRQLKNRSVIFTYNGCEAMAPKTYLSAIARIIKDGTYELVEWPRLKDHRCWANGRWEPGSPQKGHWWNVVTSNKIWRVVLSQFTRK